MSRQVLSVLQENSGIRLDIFIASNFTNHSRNFILNLIKSGKVSVCGQIKKPSYKVLPNDEVAIKIPHPIESKIKPDAIDIDIIFEDEDIVVINKRPGIVVHPAFGNPSETLVNAILYHFPEIEGVARTGIVHRLDKDTSGIIVIAKNNNAQQKLAAQFKDKKVEKRYLAIVHGKMIFPSGKIELPIGRHPIDRKKFSTLNFEHSKNAETLFKVKESFDDFSLLEVKIKTGRTHQIRVHCSAIKHPVAGDSIYGFRHLREKEKRLSISRQMLHALYIGFIHPRTENYIFFEAELFADMRNVITNLRDGIF